MNIYKLFIITVIVFSIADIYAQKEKAVIGMTLDEVKNIHPDASQYHNENGITLSRKATLYGLDSEWGYRFENRTLSWIFFLKYIDEIKEENFNKCLDATRKIIKEYSVYYSKPDTIIKGNSNFVDPYKKRHWGYDVLEARWNNFENMKIKVEFDFFGGKGEYHFIVSIKFFDKDYPYFN